MNNKTKIFTMVTPETSKLIQLVCFEKGINWGITPAVLQCLDKEIIAYNNNWGLGHDNIRNKNELSEKWNYIEVSNSDFILIILGIKEVSKPFVEYTIGGNKVNVYPGRYIEFGDTKISNDEVELLIKSYKNC